MTVQDTRVEQLAEIRSGVGFPHRYQGRERGDYPFAKVGDISAVARAGGQTIAAAANYVVEEDLSAMGARPFPSDSIVFAKIGEAIRQNFRVLTAVPMCFDNNVMGLVPNPSVVDPKYLFYCLLKVDFYRLVNTTAVPSLRRGDVGRIKIPLPPLSEQRRIAAILDKADAIRRKRREAIALTEELLRSTFLEMFGDPVTNPKGWPTRQLHDSISFLTSGSRGWAKYYADSGRVFIRIQNVLNDHLDLTDIAFVDAPPSAEAKRTKVQDGDVLLSITADLGRTGVVPPGLDAHINQHLALMRLKPGIDPYFLSAFLASAGGQHQFERLNRQGVKAGLNFDDIRSLRVPVPPIEIQTRFRRARAAIWELLKREQRALGSCTELFHSLVQRAFRGEL